MTILPTSWEWSRWAISSASSVSTMTRFSTPTRATNLLRAVDVVVAGVESHVAFGVGHVAFAVAAQPGLNLVLVERGPGAKIVPTELGRDAVEVGEVLALGRARLQHGVVHARCFRTWDRARGRPPRTGAFRRRRRWSPAAERSPAGARGRRWPACAPTTGTCPSSSSSCRRRQTPRRGSGWASR